MYTIFADWNAWENGRTSSTQARNKPLGTVWLTRCCLNDNIAARLTIDAIFFMSEEDFSKEQRILRVMRKVLASIVKDATPQPGMLHPLSERTIEDIRDCFGLISAREKELAEELGLAQERPYYPGDEKKGHVVSMPKSKK
jgi:hypothetical protein